MCVRQRAAAGGSAGCLKGAPCTCAWQALPLGRLCVLGCEARMRMRARGLGALPSVLNPLLSVRPLLHCPLLHCREPEERGGTRCWPRTHTETPFPVFPRCAPASTITACACVVTLKDFCAACAGGAATASVLEEHPILVAAVLLLLLLLCCCCCGGGGGGRGFPPQQRGRGVCLCGQHEARAREVWQCCVRTSSRRTGQSSYHAGALAAWHRGRG